MSSLLSSSVNLLRHERVGRPTVQASAATSPELMARLAVDESTRADAFTVRHDSYLSGGYIDARADGQFSDANDDMPNSQTVVIYKKDRPVASIRFCILDTDPAMHGWSDIPAMHIFPEEVKALMDQVRASQPAGAQRHPRAVEINRLVRHPDFSTDSELVFALFRFATYMTLYHDTDVMLSCVRRNHMPFYKRIIKLEDVAGPRRYAGVKFETHLMACHRAKYDAVVEEVPIFNCSKITGGGYDAMFEGETVTVF